MKLNETYFDAQQSASAEMPSLGGCAGYDLESERRHLAAGRRAIKLDCNVEDSKSGGPYQAEAATGL